MHVNDLIIVGAGPSGLAAAISAKRAGLDYRIFEKGMLVNSLFHFPSQMIFFTTPDLLEIGGLPFVTPNGKPTRDEALRYYRRVVDTYQLDIAFGVTVTHIETRTGGDEPFTIRTRHEEESEDVWHARAVVIATGCYDHPNLLGVPGEDLPQVSHYYTEPHAFYRKQVVIVGGKNSAADAALDLCRSGSHVTLVHRQAELGASIKYWVKPDIENRIKEGAIAARFETRVVEIRPGEVVVERDGKCDLLQADAVFLLTGYLADLKFLSNSGIRVNPQTFVPECDPETFQTNAPGIYLAGAVVAGANRGEVFIENGRFHGEVVVREITKQLEVWRDRPA